MFSPQVDMWDSLNEIYSENEYPRSSEFPIAQGQSCNNHGGCPRYGKDDCSGVLASGREGCHCRYQVGTRRRSRKRALPLRRYSICQNGYLKSDEVENLIARTVEFFGRLDVAINNVVHCPEKTPLMEFDETSWRRSMDVTLTGTALCLKYEMQQMKKQGSKGSIVNIASVNSFLAVPNMLAYTSTKHTLIGLTKHASNEGGPLGIRVNSIAPGPIFVRCFKWSGLRRVILSMTFILLIEVEWYVCRIFEGHWNYAGGVCRESNQFKQVRTGTWGCTRISLACIWLFWHSMSTVFVCQLMEGY